MSKLVLTIPTGDTEIIAEGISIDRAVELTEEYILKYEITDDVDFHYHTDEGGVIPL